MNLNGEWKLYYYPHGKEEINNINDLEGKSIPSVKCTVPGNVELDLSRAGILPEDLYKGENIVEAEKYEHYDWWYETEFSAVAPQKDETVLLHFGGVDCLADYYLNGEKIGSSDNMFIEHSFDVTDLLSYGKSNKLHIHISSPLTATVNAEDYGIDVLEALTNPIALNIRKAPHSYGWDIMPRAISAGIWRDVTLVYRKNCYLKTLYFKLNSIGDGANWVDMYFQAELGFENNIRHNRMVVSGVCGDSSFHTEGLICNAGKISFQIPDIKLWWPKNYGEPNLYDIKIEIFNPEGELLFHKELKQGFRTLTLHRSDIVEEGGGFEFIVNGVKIMVYGTNWVPLDAYHSRDKQRLPKALELLDDSGYNMVRCWGGNVYEDAEFFEFCDSHGIMVWQDFAMACAHYPQDDVFAEKLKKEVISVVKKFRNYACLALWSGDNEVDIMLMRHGIKPSVNLLTRKVIPEVLAQYDPLRPYIPSSPYISDEAYEKGAAFYAEDHLWDPRDYFKSKTYLASNAYFVSEIGYHGCPAGESIKKFIDPQYVWPYFDNRQWNLHSTNQCNSPDRTMLMHKQIQQFFGDVPENMDDYVTASQICQAEADKFFVEMFRAKTDTKGGIMIWNLLDGWPQMSDAVVDYYFNKKLAYHYLKRSGNPVLVMIDEMEGWGQAVTVCNSTKESAEVEIKITDVETGKLWYEKQCIATANANTRLDKLPIMYSDKGMFLIEYSVNGKAFVNTYLYGAPAFNLETYKKWMQTVNKTESELN